MIEHVIRSLKERGATLAVAESCTGGRLSAAFTETAGASEYFLGGITAYANQIKTDVLGVEREVLERYGAVSRQVAEQMAQGARRITGADFAIATTGIAGPGGGTTQGLIDRDFRGNHNPAREQSNMTASEKPVGTVWVSVATPDGAVFAQKMHFPGTRIENMESAVAAAIEALHRIL